MNEQPRCCWLFSPLIKLWQASARRMWTILFYDVEKMDCPVLLCDSFLHSYKLTVQLAYITVSYIHTS